MTLYRHIRTGALYNNHELLTFSLDNQGPNFDPFVITADIQLILEVELVQEEPLNRRLELYEFIYGAEVVQENNIWIRRPTTAIADDAGKKVMDERAATEMVAQRNIKLQLTDWTQLSDVDPEISAKYRPYRQALRDITTSEGFPHYVVWPNEPQ